MHRTKTGLYHYIYHFISVSFFCSSYFTSSGLTKEFIGEQFQLV